MTNSKNTLTPVLIGFSILFLTIVVCSVVVFHNWTTRYDIDINSGQMRKRIMVGPYVLREHIIDTSLSLFVRDELGITQPPRWEWDTTTYLYGYFRHPQYHGALSYTSITMKTMEVYRFTKEEKAQVVQALLEWLRKGNMYDKDIVYQALEPIIAEKKILYPEI